MGPRARKTWDEVKDKILAAKQPGDSLGASPKPAKKPSAQRKDDVRLPTKPKKVGKDDAFGGEPLKHEVVGKTVGGVKQKTSSARPEMSSVYYKDGTRSGNRSKPFDTGR